MIKMTVVLTSICLIAALLLVATYNMTIDKIHAQETNAEKEALKLVIPEASGFSEKITGKQMEYYKAFGENNEVIGYAFIGDGKGYSSILKIMIGVDKDCNVKGIKIVSQNETPGLGTRVNEIRSKETIWNKFSGEKAESETEPWFQAQFKTESPDEVDIITGATITSKSVIRIVKEAVEKFKKEAK